MQQAANTLGDVSSSQCWELLQKNNTSFLIDVRSPEEWNEYGIADLSSLHQEVRKISWLFFTPNIHKNNRFIDELNKAVPDKQTQLLFICKSGGRSLQAAQAAMSAGYSDCYNVNDGFAGNMFDEDLNNLNLNGWVNSNLPWRKI